MSSTQRYIYVCKHLWIYTCIQKNKFWYVCTYIYTYASNIRRQDQFKDRTGQERIREGAFNLPTPNYYPYSLSLSINRDPLHPLNPYSSYVYISTQRMGLIRRQGRTRGKAFSAISTDSISWLWNKCNTEIQPMETYTLILIYVYITTNIILYT
jgi:hypothetical protein